MRYFLLEIIDNLTDNNILAFRSNSDRPPSLPIHPNLQNLLDSQDRPMRLKQLLQHNQLIIAGPHNNFLNHGEHLYDFQIVSIFPIFLFLSELLGDIDEADDLFSGNIA